MRWKTLISAAVALLLIAVLLPSFPAAVWDGHFPPTVVFNQGEALNADPDTFLFAVCWQEVEAEVAMRSGPESEVSFVSADRIDGNRFTVSVPCSGGSGPFGVTYSYVQPKWIVAQYSAPEDESSIQRKRLDIPAGRGGRLVEVSLP